MKHMVDDFAIYARQPRPGQMQPVDLAGPLARRARSVRQSAAHTSRCPSRTRPGRSSRASPPACARCSTISCRTRSTPSPTRAEPRFAITLVARRRRGDARRSPTAAPASPTTCSQHAFEPYVTTKAKGTGLGPRHREEDRRRARRSRRARQRAAARRARHARVSRASASRGVGMTHAHDARQGNPDRRRRGRHPRAPVRDPAGRGLSRARSPRTRARRARIASAQQPALVLLDIWMPDTDGVTLLREWARVGPAHDAGRHDVGARHDRDRGRGDARSAHSTSSRSRSACRSCSATIARALKNAAAREPRRISLAALGTQRRRCARPSARSSSCSPRAGRC